MVRSREHMHHQARTVDVNSTAPERTDYDRFADYEDGNDLVVCDRRNPQAWIKSDTVARIDR